MEQINVKDHFAAQATQYELLMEKLIPYYKEQHKIIHSLLPDVDNSYRVLDLGCGNGVLSEIVFSKLPNSFIVAIDITEDMLLAYKQKLAKHTGKYELQLKDFKSEEIGNKYNIILAGLTLHHLDLNERKLYYKKLYNSLTSNGMILSRDIIIDEDNLVKQEQYQIWKKFMNLKGENAESWYQKHLIKDNPPTLSQIISWHKEAGFKDAGCYWRYCNFAITMARKDN